MSVWRNTIMVGERLRIVRRNDDGTVYTGIEGVAVEVNSQAVVLRPHRLLVHDRYVPWMTAKGVLPVEEDTLQVVRWTDFKECRSVPVNSE